MAGWLDDWAATTPLAIAFVVVAAPWVILHYAVAWRRACALTDHERRLLWDLKDAAANMAERLGVLEDHLDYGAPQARGRSWNHARKTH